MIKYSKLYVFIIAITFNCQVFAQPDTVRVCSDKVVYAIFNDPVQMIDLGKDDYHADAHDNMVMIKSKGSYAQPTSLMIKTANDVVVFMVVHDDNIDRLLIDKRTSQHAEFVEQQLSSTSPSNGHYNAITIPKKNPQSKAVQQNANRAFLIPKSISKRQANGNRNNNIGDARLQQKVYNITKEKRKIHNYGSIDNNIAFTMHNVFVDEQFAYVKLVVANNSSISFKLDLLTLEKIQGVKFKKNVAEHGEFLYPAYWEVPNEIGVDQEEELIYILDLVAFREEDKIRIKIDEIDGERSLSFSIPVKLVNKATRI